MPGLKEKAKRRKPTAEQIEAKVSMRKRSPAREVIGGIKEKLRQAKEKKAIDAGVKPYHHPFAGEKTKGYQTTPRHRARAGAQLAEPRLDKDRSWPLRNADERGKSTSEVREHLLKKLRVKAKAHAAGKKVKIGTK